MKLLQCFLLKEKNPKHKFIFKGEFSVKEAETAKSSIEKEITQTENSQALTEFLSKDPVEEVGHVSESLIKLNDKSPEEKTAKVAGELDDFIDTVADRIEGDDKVKSLFERDLIASYQLAGGIGKINSKMNMKSLNINKAHIELRNGHIHVIGEGEEGGMYSIIEFPLKSSLREKAEEKHAKTIEKTKVETEKLEQKTGEALNEAVDGGKTDTSQLTKAAEKIKSGESTEKIMKETGLDKKNAELVKESRERERKFEELIAKERNEKIYSTEEMRLLKEREVRLDKDIIQRWAYADKSDPALFKHITNVDYVQALLAQPPFEWSLGQLHTALKDGRDSILDFDDLIDEDGLKIGDVDDFEETYNKMAPTAALYFDLKEKRGNQQNAIDVIQNTLSGDSAKAEDDASRFSPDQVKALKEMIKIYEAELAKTKEEFEKKEAEYKKIEKKYSLYRDVIRQGIKIMDALEPENFHIEQIEKENKTADRMAKMLSEAKETDLEGKIYGPYSLNALNGAPSKLDLDDYGVEKQGEKYGISVDQKLFDTWKADLINALEDFLKEKYAQGEYGSKDSFGVERSKIKKMPPHVLLKLVGDIYGYENLVSQGHINKYKEKGEEGQTHLILKSLPQEIAKPSEAKTTENSPIYKLLQSIEHHGHSLSTEYFTYNSELASKINFEKAKPLQKIEAVLGKIFDKNHIGDKIVGGKGTFALELADGTHRTVYKDQFTAFMTGESAFEHVYDEIEEGAMLEATAKGEGLKDIEKYVLKKMLLILNAYIELGSLNSEILGKKESIPALTLEDIQSGKISQKQIEAIQIGATIEFAQAAEFDALSQISDPSKQKVIREFLWKHPGLEEDKKRNIIKAIEKIDLGAFGAYVQQTGPKVSAYGVGYQKSFPLPYGLSFSMGMFGFEHEGSIGGGAGVGVGGRHKVNESFRINWGITAGAGASEKLGVPFVASNVSADIKMTDAYDFSLGAWVGSDLLSIVRGGVSVAVKADVERSYKAQRLEKYEQLGINELNKFLKGPHPIHEKVAAIEANKTLGPLINKMTKAFSDLQEKLGRPVSERMREDLTLQTYNIILNHINVNEDANWTPEVLNSIGFSIEVGPNILESARTLLAGLLSFNIKGKTYVIPIATPGGPKINEGYLSKEMIAALRKRIAENKKIALSDVIISEERMTNEGLLLKVPGPDGKTLEYRSTYNTESIADLSRKDRSFDTMKDAMREAHIAFTRDADGESFTMNVLSAAGTKLRKSTVMLSVDPKLQQYVDVIAGSGNQFKIKFKKGFKKFGRFFISRQDFISSHRYKDAPKLTKIMLKSDLSSDSMLEQESKHTSLIKYYGYKQAERGPLRANNNLWESMAEFKKHAEANKYEFLHLNDRDLSQAEKAQLEKNAEIDKAFETAFGVKMPSEKEIAAMRTNKEIDTLVDKFLTFLKNPRERRKHPEINKLYLKINESGVVDSQNSDKLMMIMQKYVTEVLKQKPLSVWELPAAKNYISINRFTNVTKYIPTGEETPKEKERKIKLLQKTLRKRIPFYLNVADKAFAGTFEGKNQADRKAMLAFLKERLNRKISGLSGNMNLEEIRRENVGQFIGSMAGMLMNKKHGRIADLDAYGMVPGREKELFKVFGVENLSIHDQGTEGKVARAILEIENPHNLLAEGKEFMEQGLAVQMAIHAKKFFSVQQREHLVKIRKGEKMNDAMMKTFELFRGLVNMARIQQESLNPGEVQIIDLGPMYKNAKVVVKAISVKDFFFERCGNETWGVGAGVDVYPTGEELPVYVGKRVKGRIKAGVGTQVSYVTVSLFGAYEKRVQRRQEGKHLEPEDTNVENSEPVDTVTTPHRPRAGQAGGSEIQGQGGGGTTAPHADTPGSEQNQF